MNRKYRITKVTYSNGNEWFHIQYRYLWVFWKDYESLTGLDSYDNFEEAKRRLDQLKTHITKTQYYYI
jgi:hypothetical protein